MINYSEALMKVLGQNVKELRKVRGWTQQDLADAVGAHRVTIAYLEIGARMPDFDFVCRLADALEVTTDQLRRPIKILQASA